LSERGHRHPGLLCCRCTGKGAEGVEGEHGIGDPEALEILVPGGLDGLVHPREEVQVVWVEEVYHILAAADLLELDAQALVGPVQEAGGNPELRELAVEQHDPLGEAEVGPCVQGVVIAE